MIHHIQIISLLNQVFTSTDIDKNITDLGDLIIGKSATYLLKSEKYGSVSDDIIELNIGGQKMTTLRSTLTAIPNSKLALMFSKNNTKNMLPIDKHGAVFFDYNPLYFNYLLDQLRIIKRMPKRFEYQFQFSSPPYINNQVNFTQILVDFGLTRKYNISIDTLHILAFYS